MLNKYHAPIGKEIPSMSNDKLLEEYLNWFCGDGEDGCSSESCDELLNLLSNELSKRLIAIGFLKEKI